MKTRDPRDPLDRKIDALLCELPAPAPADFLARTLEQAEAATRATRSPQRGVLLRFALPAAAAIALALVMTALLREAPSPGETLADTRPSPDAREASELYMSELPGSELEELLLLEDGLTGLAALPADDAFNSEDLLNTLDTLYYHFES
jgi:hypothetical protein